MEKWLWKTAWPMTPPSSYSAFHIIFALAGISAAAVLAALLRKLPRPKRVRLLFTVGILLCSTEIYKQLFLYYVVNARHYDWWFFPFQLCSLPMYFCLLLPFAGRRLQRVLCTFMFCYNLPGAFLVFVDPSGLMHPYWTLTLHSFLWHIFLIFIGFFIAFSGMAGRSRKDFSGATAIFAGCCLIATVINVAAHPYGNADMFYITPYYPTTQMIYRDISAALGLLPGILIYLLSIVLGGAILQVVYIRLSRGADADVVDGTDAADATDSAGAVDAADSAN